MAHTAIIVFLVFVGLVLGLSFYFARKASTASSYFAAGGHIHYSVNGIAFAGDYLSAASFLGICGMIATVGYDGFLYSIGYLAGWVVALFVVAEPMKRLGKYTFTDALDAKFNSKGIQLAAALSTLVVSIFYLIPQMVGAGVLVTPLLGLPHHVGVIMVGAIVITIVATAGMTSTTYVQFLKGGLLIIFSIILVAAVMVRGLSTSPDQGGEVPYHKYKTIAGRVEGETIKLDDKSYQVLDRRTVKDKEFIKLTQSLPVTRDDEGVWAAPFNNSIVRIDGRHSDELDRLLSGEGRKVVEIDGQRFTVVEINGAQVLAIDAGQFVEIDGIRFIEDDGSVIVKVNTWWMTENLGGGKVRLHETQWVTMRPDGGRWVNGAPSSPENGLMQVGNLEAIGGRVGPAATTGRVGPFKFLSLIGDEKTVVRRWSSISFADGRDDVTLFHPVFTAGNKIMRPGLKFKVGGTGMEKLNFISLMLALFCGTAALPHILIRYYTVRSTADARKSTIVAIAAIGFFYILTLFMGLGAMTNGVINLADNNMSGPLLARSFGTFLFAVISAIAFATVLGTVSGLIVAASGAVAHDFLDRFAGLHYTDKQKVYAGRVAAFSVGLIAIILGIVFQGMNVSYLVGWAFAVAASANLPSIIMLLFWKRTTAQGIVASIAVGCTAALGIIMLSPSMWGRYGLDPAGAPIPFSNPGIISIPLSFLTLVIVSLATQKNGRKAVEA